MTIQLYRECLITIADTNGIIKQVSGYDSDGPARGGLRVSFTVERRYTMVADSAVVKIYNLSPKSRGLLAQRSIFMVRKDPIRYIQVSAGYRGETGAIFNGAIIRVIHRREGPDWITTIEGNSVIAQSFSNIESKSWKSNTGKVSMEAVINNLAVATKLGTPSYSPEAAALIKTKFTDSHVVSGSAYNEIKKSLTGLGLNMIVDVDKVSIMVTGQPKNPENAIVISEKTGLIETPQTTDMGAEIRTLLDYRITPGQLMNVESQTFVASNVGLTNQFTAMDVTVIGDTHGNDWYSNISAWFYPTLVPLADKISGIRPVDPVEN